MHPLRRKIAIVLLSLGTVVGYGSGLAHMRCCHRHRQQTFEQHVARVCIDAARSGRVPSPRSEASAASEAGAEGARAPW